MSQSPQRAFDTQAIDVASELKFKFSSHCTHKTQSLTLVGVDVGVLVGVLVGVDVGVFSSGQVLKYD